MSIKQVAVSKRDREGGTAPDEVHCQCLLQNYEMTARERARQRESFVVLCMDSYRWVVLRPVVNSMKIAELWDSEMLGWLQSSDSMPVI